MSDSPAGPVERASRRLVPWLISRRRRVLWAALALSGLSLFFSVLLYSDLRSGIEELLPESAPSVVAARTLSGKLRSFSRLSVVLEGAPGAGDALARFADDLAPRLRALPSGLVESVDYQTTEQERFTRRFGGLLLPLPKLRALRDQLAARVSFAQRRVNPLVVDLADLEEEPAPGSATARDGPPAAPPAVELPAEVAQAARFRDGRFQTPDGRLLVLQVRPPDASTEAGRNARLLEAVQREVAALGPSGYHPSLRIGYCGEVAELVEEQAALVADLASSTVVVLLLVVLALYLYFRSWTVLAALFGALAVGCAACFGAGFFLVGHLNANTAFLGSIVVGNGINVGIVFMARFLEERRATGFDEAVRRAWAQTLPATFVAASGAALAYLSLAATDFRGFSQFGVLGAVGMSLCWLTAYLLLPPLLAALQSRLPAPALRRPGLAGGLLARLAERIVAQPVAFALSGALALAGAGLAVARHQGPIVELDTSQLRAKKSLESGAQRWSMKADEVFHSYLNPVVLRASTPDGLSRTLAALERRRAALGAADPLGEVRSLASLVPPLAEQEAKLVLLREVRGLLSDQLLARLPEEQREQALELRPAADLRPLAFADLPAPLRLALTERDGAVGTLALLYPRETGILDLRAAGALKQLVRAAIADAGSGAQAVNPLFLLSDIDEAIWRDGPRATLVALLAVCLLVTFVLRRAAPSAQVLGSLLLGLAGLVGLAAAAQVRVNFLNFVVLPITFGIGVDYAINIVQRHRQEGPGSMVRVLRETGSAVALCSATTIIGYGSLWVADNQALAGFGVLASLGEVTCLSAALLVLPAVLVLREGRRPRLVAGAEAPDRAA